MTVKLSDDLPVGTLYLSGKSLDEVAQHFGAKSRTPVRNWLKRNDVAIRPAHVALHPTNTPKYGADNAAWVGDEANYSARHARVKLVRGKAAGPCAECYTMETPFRFEWAQIHGTTGLSPEDYQSMCRPCHEAYDSALTPEQLDEIRALRYFAGVTHQRLSEMYGITQPHITMILNGRRLKGSSSSKECFL